VAYPALPDLGGCDAIGIQRGYQDPTIATPFESGAVQTRPRFSRVRRTFMVPYKYITPAMRTALDEFVRNVVLGASGIFVWTDPETQEEINVRFASGKLPQINEAGWVGDRVGSGAIAHSLNLELEEV
jgi:hypothetical protein